MSKHFFLCLIGSILAITLRHGLNFINISLGIIFIIYLILRERKSLPFVVAVFSFFLLMSSFNIKTVPKDISGQYKVIETHENYLVLKGKVGKFVSYDDYDFLVGTDINLKGITTKLVTGKSSSVSSFNDYLSTQGINYQLTINEYEIVKNGPTLREKVISFLTSNLKEESANMVKLILLGDKSYLPDFYDQLIELSVVQLFVISGFHLNIINGLFDRIFKKHPNVLLATPFLLLPYIWLLRFSIPVLRAFLFIVGYRYAKRFNIPISRIGLLSLIAMSFLIYDYHLLYSLSFQLSFTVTMVIEFLALYPKQNFIFKWLLRPILLQLSVMPIIMSINYQIAPLSFIFNTLLSLPIALLYGLSWLVSIFKFLDAIYYPFVHGMFAIINNLTIVSPIIITGKPYFPFAFMQYIFLGLFVYYGFIHQKRLCYLSLSFVFIACILNIYHCDIFAKDSVTFLDVGQGDATLICDNHNQTTILIDTGGSIYYDVATTKLIPYLRANGIREIDYVLLTHLDYDHSGALDSLKEHYQVKNIIYGYEHSNIKCDDIAFYNLNNYSALDNNEGSAVFYFHHASFDFLIMGDAPTDIEQKIIKDNPELSVDVLRIGHHGSKTSSCEEFLSTVNPSLAIISVGKNNYGHPSKEVINRLNDLSLVYFRTDEQGNIIVTRNGARVRV